jgi:hypothetical protein
MKRIRVDIPDNFLFASWLTKTPKFLVGKRRPVVSETKPDVLVDFLLSYDEGEDNYDENLF